MSCESRRFSSHVACQTKYMGVLTVAIKSFSREATSPRDSVSRRTSSLRSSVVPGLVGPHIDLHIMRPRVQRKQSPKGTDSLSIRLRSTHAR
eukprot:3560672-Amphidinium_carterae.1